MSKFTSDFCTLFDILCSKMFFILCRIAFKAFSNHWFPCFLETCTCLQLTHSEVQKVRLSTSFFVEAFLFRLCSVCDEDCIEDKKARTAFHDNRPRFLEF